MSKAQKDACVVDVGADKGRLEELRAAAFGCTVEPGMVVEGYDEKGCIIESVVNAVTESGVFATSIENGRPYGFTFDNIFPFPAQVASAKAGGRAGVHGFAVTVGMMVRGFQTCCEIIDGFVDEVGERGVFVTDLKTGAPFGFVWSELTAYPQQAVKDQVATIVRDEATEAAGVEDSEKEAVLA